MPSSMFDAGRIVATRACAQGHPVPVTLGDARRHATLPCPTCGEKIVLRGTLGQIIQGGQPSAEERPRAPRSTRGV